MNANIIGTGSYLPKKILTNYDLEKMVDTSNEWIVTRTGIKERRIAADDEYTSDMGVEAAKKAIKDAEIGYEEIDFIMTATLTPDYIFPSTSCIIQKKIKAYQAAAVDIQAACSGYIYALSLAKALVEQKVYKNILIIASEKLSSIVDYKDRSTCVLFGDGAAAAVVGLKNKGYEIKGVSLGADGRESDLLILPGGGCRYVPSHETIDRRLHYVKMAGNEVFKHAIRKMEFASKDCLKKVGLQEEDIDWLIPHQANERIIMAIAKRFKNLPLDKVYKSVIEKYGNTSASSVGIALDELDKEGRVKNGENILFTVFGAGFTWGAAIITKRG
ncbi:MAG: 3-oxoacyl-ACP synthase [Chlamydiae bacterium SM23_39]|nr:MAG: 3-oxoacyl-ACP synthase [Chlamydiae bacterium SM23_39]